MGMEGQIRQVSEFALASYRKTPAKLYQDLLAKYESRNVSALTSMMRESQNSPAMQRIKQRISAGLAALQDLDAPYRQQQALVSKNRGALNEVQADLMGLSKDGI
jgi:hypothetical protein